MMGCDQEAGDAQKVRNVTGLRTVGGADRRRRGVLREPSMDDAPHSSTDEWGARDADAWLRRYSYRSACIGSTRDARSAGM